MRDLRVGFVAGAVLFCGLWSSRAMAAAIVSIDVDDGYADAMQAASALDARGMRGTFFIIGAYLGKPGHMTADQVRSLAAAGHEIGGHSVTHPDLTTLPLDEAQRQICIGRDILLDLGLDVRSFAYPYGITSADVEAVVAGCGFDSARIVGSDAPSLTGEVVPPLDPFAIRTRGSIESSTTLAEIQSWVQAAEQDGAWLHLIFHHVCDGACDTYSISPADFGALLDWLASRVVLGTTVQTVNEAIGGPPQPAVPGLPPTERGSSNLVLNPSMEVLDAWGNPECWQKSAWGNNVATMQTVGGAFDGAWAARIGVTSFTDGGLRYVPTLDLGHCAPPGTPGHSYRVTGYYRGTARPILVMVYRDAIGQWRWWTQGSYLPPATSWTQTTFTSPPLPQGASAVSFGLSVYGTGDLTVDDFTLVDMGPTPPAVALVSPADASFVRGNVTLTATASSAIGIDRVEFLVDGALMASDSTAPYSAAWDTSALEDGSIQVAARAVDAAGVASIANAAVTVANQAGLLLNPSLEAVNAVGVPGCWQRVSWGTNAATWASTTDAHAGTLAQRVDVTAFTSGGNRLMPSLDSGSCAPRATPGHTYTITGWYRSTVSPVLVLNYRNASGSWVWWAQSAGLPAAPGWTSFTYTSPRLPSGATAVSFGLSLYGTGSLTVDDFGFTMN